PDVVHRRPLVGGGPEARVREVVGVDELVAVVSPAEDVDGRTVGDELEQHTEDPEAAVPEDRPGADDGHVEAGGDRLATQHLRLVVEHDVDAVARGTDGVPIPHVSLDELDRGRGGGGRVDVDDSDPVAVGDGAGGDDLAEVAAPAGVEDRSPHQIRSPRSTHQRTLARMPATSPVFGSYPRSARALEMSHAIVSLISPRTCSACTYRPRPWRNASRAAAAFPTLAGRCGWRCDTVNPSACSASRTPWITSRSS